MYFILLLVICILFIILSTSRLNLHPFIALLLAAFFYGVAAGMPAADVLQFLSTGFGDTVGKVGILITFGVIIGTFLEKSGGALRLAERILSITGKNRVHSANAIIGYLVSIPVFADSGFLILSSLNRAMTKKARLSLAGTVAALALGLTASHTMVPPTPGPIAAAGIIGADLGLVFLIGLITSLFALFICILFSRYIGKRLWIDPSDNPNLPGTDEPEPGDAPPARVAILPLIVPIILILLRSIAGYPTHPLGTGSLVNILSLLGEPVIALAAGVLLALILPKRLERSMLGTSGWIGESLKSAAVIILITGAGGALGSVLQHSELGVTLSEWIKDAGAGIWVPFIMAAAIKTAQGSSTVSLITTASIMAPLLPAMGLDSSVERAMVVIAIGAGAAVVSHANDSFFWVMTQLSGFTVKQGYRTQTVGTAVLGISAILFLSVLALFIT